MSANDNLLTIVQNMTGELGLPQPTVVAASTDPGTIQYFTLVKRELKELVQSHPWTALQSLFIVNLPTITTDTGNLTSGSPNITGLLAGTITTINNAGASAWNATDAGGLFPVSTRVISASGTTVICDSNATAAKTGATITFSQDTFALPSDFDRYLGQTWWDRTNRWALLGPDTPQIDQWHRSGIVVTGPRRHWRQVGATASSSSVSWRIWPPLTSATTNAQELIWEYLSNKGVWTTGGTTKQLNFTADTDVPILDSDAITLGLKWRWLQAKRYQYADIQQEYLDYVDRLKARDGGNRILTMSPAVDQDYLIDSRNVPDGFYPGGTTTGAYTS
jgi:hypothetical protein